MERTIFDKSRIIGFSDAVFSIAMTLLILEIAVPTYQSLNKYGMWSLLKTRVPNFIGFIISFFVTALYWIDYMKITKYLRSFNTKTLWINILLLFFVVLLPFSTALYVNGIKHVEPFVFYSSNLAMIAVMILILIHAIPQEDAKKTGFTALKRKWQSRRITNTVFTWILAIILAFIYMPAARATFILIFVIDPIIDRYYKKKINS